MTKRISVVVLIALAWARPAHANVSGGPIGFGNQPVSSTNLITAGLNGGLTGDHIDHFDLSAAGCSQFAISPSSGDAGGVSGPLQITVTFAPVSHGAVDCIVATYPTPANAVSNGSFELTGFGTAAIANITTSGTDFGSVPVASGSSTQTFTVANGGEIDLTIQQPTMVGDFAIVSPLGTQVVPSGQQRVYTVAFDPSAVGARSGSITFSTDDSSNPVQSFGLSGIGTGPPPVIDVADVDFGSVVPGQSLAKPVAVTNTGGPLTVSSATLSGGSWFSFDPNGHACAGQTCNFTAVVPPELDYAVRCSPGATDTGMQTAMLTVGSNSVGGKSTATLTCSAGRPDITVDTTTLMFGDVRVPMTLARTFVVSNPGTAPLTITAITTTGTNPGEYSITPPCAPCSIAAMATKTFTVTFAPATPGAANIAISIANTSPDPGDNPQTIAVTGNGIAPQISAPMAVSFGSIELGAMATQPIAISNVGTAPLAITSATITALPGDFMIVGTPAAAPIAVGGTATWMIQCKPQAPAGLRTGTFEIKSDSFSQATVDISLMCTGDGGAITAAPATLVFGGIAVNTTATRTFTLSNPGTLDVVGFGAAITGGTGYAIEGTLPATLPAGSSQTVTVDFAPLTVADGGAATIALTGTWGTSSTSASAMVMLTGTALSADLNVSPPALDFQSFPYDTTPTAKFCIINSSQTTVHIASLMINATGSTASTEFAVTGIVKQSACGTGGTAQNLPYDLAASENLQVTVKAQPANRAGSLTANAVVLTTLPVNPTRTVTLAGTATTGLLAVTPGLTVDFGGVDVDTGPAMKTIVLKNTGDGPVTLASFLASNAKFAVALPGATTLMPNETLPLVVTYDPSVVASDSMTIAHSIQHSVTQMTEVITITGRGTDRVLSVPQPIVTAPDTFRNPGSKAPVVLADVANTGTAPLHISAAMIDATDTWKLVDTTPIVVAPGETHHVMVAFAPTRAGMVPDAQLVLTTDAGDPPNLTKLATITLRGMGLDRRAMIGPQPIDLGFTGVGVPLTATDILAITSMDAANSYQIRKLELADPAVFAIDDAPVAAPLAPAATNTYSVTFVPLVEGNFTTTISLFLDEDTVAQGTTTITGHAVTLDVHGGGGCNSGGGGGGLLLVLAVLGVTLRRRAVIAVVAVGALAFPLTAHADDVDLTVFAPTPQTTGNAFHVQSADVGHAGDFAIATVVSYASNPLVIGAKQMGAVVGADDVVVKQRILFDLGAAIAFLGRFEAGLRMPFYSQSGDAFDPKVGPGMPGASGAARGNLAVNAKVRLARWPGFTLGAGASVSLPTATKGEMTGSTKPEVHALLLGTYTRGTRLTLNANAGAAIRAKETYFNIQQKSGFAWGLGASYRITDEIWATAELFGEVAASSGPTLSTVAPMEGLAGGNFHLGDAVTLGLALGRGLTSAVGAPELRGVLSLSYTQAAPPPPRPAAPVTIDGDADGDGIPDSRDKCPNEPEDKDMFQDEDGCPDLDNDGDGIPDAKDKCPLDPEDKDGFQDEDGCPDKDNDGDGIPDELDKCPNVPEDKDGFQDLDGCPDLDNDNDGIPDAKDRCPNEPETINGVQDEDGCPDVGDSTIMLSPDRIETLEAVQFGHGATLAKSSAGVLGQIGATLRAHAEIIRVRVGVHVQPTHDGAKDQELSTARAQAVKDWLVKYGIAEKRLDVRGFGGTKPLVGADQKGAAQLNDRLELVIMERK